MIDEKKIQEAAVGMFNVGGLVNTVERIAFKEGVKWFKHAIWHEASVKPEGNAVILYQQLDDRGTMDVGIDGVFSDVEWAKFVAYNSITKWCYIEDLLPKGGEK